MSNQLLTDAIHVTNINLWSHVGVLEHERIMGQEFELDFTLWLNVTQAAINDDLSFTQDYSIAIRDLQTFSLDLYCYTIERFSQLILDRLEGIYGLVPMRVRLRKCSPPVPGFLGSVVVERWRHSSASQLL